MDWDCLFHWVYGFGIPVPIKIIDINVKIIMTTILAVVIYFTFKTEKLNLFYKILEPFVVNNIYKDEKNEKAYSIYVKNISATVMSGIYIAIFAPVIFGSHITSTGIDINADARMWQPIVTGVGGLLVLITVVETRRKNDVDIVKQENDRRADIASRRYDQQVKALEQMDTKNSLITRTTGLRTLLNLANEMIEEGNVQQVQDIVNDLCNYIRMHDSLVLNKYFTDYKGNKEKNILYAKDNQNFVYDYNLLEPRNLSPDEEIMIKNEAKVRILFFDSIRNYLKNSSNLWIDIEFDFSDSIFFYDVDLSGISWGSRVKFSNSIFLKEVNFSESHFKKEAMFNGIEIYPLKGSIEDDSNVYANFSGVTYEDKACFQNSEFCRSVSFQRSSFLGETNFSGVTYEDKACFQNSEFCRSVSFQRSSFLGETDFLGSKFAGKTIFDNSVFIEIAYFQSIVSNNISSEISYNGCWFYKQSVFNGMNVFNSSFNDCVFLGVAQFHNARFYQTARFENIFSIDLNSKYNCDSNYYYFDLGSVGFYNGAEFSNAIILSNMCITGVFYIFRKGKSKIKYSLTPLNVLDNTCVGYSKVNLGRKIMKYNEPYLCLYKNNGIRILLVEESIIEKYQEYIEDKLPDSFFCSDTSIAIRKNALEEKNNIDAVIKNFRHDYSDKNYVSFEKAINLFYE